MNPYSFKGLEAGIFKIKETEIINFEYFDYLFSLP